MIVIPMVGRSRRFLDAGYRLPKHQLQLWGRSVFFHAVSSFEHLFEREEILIVSLHQDGLAEFIRREMCSLGVKSWRLVELPSMTSGQADTVLQGILAADVACDCPLTIFNVDTFRPGFRYPNTYDVQAIDGYLECFIGQGANWSNVVPSPLGQSKVLRTSEKMQESEYCCTGLYYFKAAGAFIGACNAAMERWRNSESAGEIYVAPLYNELIAKGLDIRFSVIKKEEVMFCGIPSEYESLLARGASGQQPGSEA